MTLRNRLRHTQATVCVTAVIAALSNGMPATAAFAQSGRTRVTYDVEFSTTGALLDKTCTATGTDVLIGTLVGFEPPVPGEDNEYVGMLTRNTRISTCGTRRNAAGQDNVCNVSYSGNGIAEVVFTLYADKRGGWLQYITNRAQYAALLPAQRPVGTYGSSVNGTCDPAEMAQMQADYDEGETAGSPSGQPIEVPGLPPLSSPITSPLTFPAKPPESIWTLKILSRRP